MKAKGRNKRVYPGVMFPLLPIGAGANNYLCLLQSQLTRVTPGVKTFPIVCKSRLLAGVLAVFIFGQWERGIGKRTKTI